MPGAHTFVLHFGPSFAPRCAYDSFVLAVWSVPHHDTPAKGELMHPNESLIVGLSVVIKRNRSFPIGHKMHAAQLDW